jgi:hypothetical protein
MEKRFQRDRVIEYRLFSLVFRSFDVAHWIGAVKLFAFGKTKENKPSERATSETFQLK